MFPLQPPPPTNQTPSHKQTLPAVEQQIFRERHDNSSDSPAHSRSNHSNAIPRPNSNNQRTALTSDLYGKATDWFWRYHQRDHSITWSKLCKALREQSRDSRTDIDFLELIRVRKQKPNETFDSFYEAVNELVDRLKTPIEDTTLVEILRRNLLPDIQHEILNTQIYTVQHLRDVCRRREFFMADIRRKHGFNLSRVAPIQKRICEIEDKFSEEPVEILVCDGDEVAEINLVCSNCQKPGHRYQNCLSVRTIFCYGCGKTDTYKL
ncbi:hypothetical protein CVS40_11355 [Lucilia cuprina]|nr:hypothetical protein CVS40_11355 [Lucilia cuprina]